MTQDNLTLEGASLKSLSNLWRDLADELAGWCHTSTTRDFKTVTSRIEHEGLSFLTITLPSFCSDFENCLEEGFVDDNHFVGFKRRGGLPKFLSGFLRQVFDSQSGLLLMEPNIDCIFAIRQLTRLFKKIELPCSDARIARAMHGYISCEQDVARWDDTVSATLLTEFQDMSRLLFADVFTVLDKRIYDGNVTPRHGPGATADGYRGNAKFRQQYWTQRLEELFPFREYSLPNLGFHYESEESMIDILEPGRETPVSVVSVPKTLKTPRIIAEEPAHIQYMQQAILRPLVRELEDPKNLVSNFLGFSDQIPNKEMARISSSNGILATLDLKEASDRVSNVLVELLTSDFPWVSAAFQATRSTKAEISSLGMSIPRLRKFASMGSALCFPVEAMVFLTIVMIGIQRNANKPLRTKDLLTLVGKVRVYGDDIIIPTDCVHSVLSALNNFNCLVNYDKSFWNGKFRESCGGDYFDGRDVRPVYLSQPIPTTLKDASGLASLVAFRNQLYQLGFWITAMRLDDHLMTLLKGHFPIVEPTSALLGRTSVVFPYGVDWADPGLQVPMVKGAVAVPRIPNIKIEGPWALVKCLSSPEIFEDDRHLERSGRPSVVDIKLRWMTPF